MKQLSQQKIGFLTAIVVFLAFATVKAATSYTASVDSSDFSAFPAVTLSLKISGDTEGLAARNIAVYENGDLQTGPLVFLPPAAPNKKIDLVILLDRSGNAKPYAEVIRAKLAALVGYMKDDGVDLKIHFSTFGAGDSSAAAMAQEFTDESAFLNSLTSTPFDSTGTEKILGLEKISSLATEMKLRSDAEKVMLIVNATPFYVDEDSAVMQNLTDSVKALASEGFLPLVVGYPFKSLHSLKVGDTTRIEDASLSHALPGGYLGAFSTDLTRLYDLLKNRDQTHFTLYFMSDLLTSQASKGSGSIFIYNNTAGYFSYPEITDSAPVINHLTTTSVMNGDAIPLQVEVAPQGKMVSEVELTYLNQSEAFQTILLKKSAFKSTAESQIYEGQIPAGDYPEDGAHYFATVYTPFDQVGGGEDMVTVDVDLYDDGINLNHQINVENGVRSINWSWWGKTVELGTKYEIWAGKDKLAETPANIRSYSIPIGECNRYQIVKVRVFVRPGVEHPKAGDWSLFSRPGEYYSEDPSVAQDSFIESFAAQKMIQCLEDSQYETVSSFTAIPGIGYQASKMVILNRQLYYLTAMLKLAPLSDLRYERYGLLYFFMDFINQEDFDTYGLNEDPIPLKLLYKVITQANQTDGIGALYEDSMEELSIRLRGNTSI